MFMERATNNPAIRLKVLRPAPPSSLDIAAQSFFLSREAMRCTAATLIWYRKYVGALVAHLAAEGIADVEAITTDSLRGFLVHLQQRGLADTTIHHHASAARTFCNYLVEEGLLTVSPMSRVKMPRLNNDALPALSPAEVQKLLKACQTTRDTAMVLTLLDSGVRAAEFVALNVGDLDIATGSLLVRLGKGRKTRTTYVGAKARRAILKYLLARGKPRAEDPLWLNEQTNDRLTDSGLRQALERIAKRAGVEDVSPHVLRRTFALWSLRSGMDVYSLQRLMGHADLAMLRKYLALVQSDLEAAHKRHGAVDTLL